MRRKTVPAPPPDTLTARIETVAQTCFIAAQGHTGRGVEDEAILGGVGAIECIGPSYRRFLGQPIEMAFICARSFELRELTPTANKSLLLPLQLGKKQRSLMV